MFTGGATAAAPAQEWRKSLGRALGLFRALYGSNDGVTAVDPRVRRFVDGVRAMVGTTDLSGYRRDLGARAKRLDRAAEVALLANLLEHTRAELAKGPLVSKRLDAGYREATAALDALEGAAR